ncbi:hypothetical protein FNF28_01506 [Cafeteria roenbergensis]|uniref:Uncharacterized protein n=1 Tax=Cafeteria roenbergensis TaxID=33653 RepID=A0A5A8DYI2_CAFRO|nr:hypothetical protein FNF28_01506 [Cafeteria roenbergensis]
MAARGHAADESKSAARRGRAAAAVPPALPPPDAHVRALSAAHAEKTKSLLKSIDRLKAEISTLRAANKEHHRSAHIRALQRRLREQELVSDVLKQSLQSASAMTAAEVDDLVIRKTVAGPLRFRPKSREELANEVRALAQANDALRTRLETVRAARPAPAPPAAAAADSASPGSGSESARVGNGSSLPSLPGAAKAARGLDGGPFTASDVGLLRAADALGAEGDAAALREEAARLRTAVESREALLGRQAGEIEELERRVDQLTEFEDKARRLARKYLRVKAEAAALAADRSSSRGLTEEAELSSRRLRDRAAVLQAENADLSERLRREVAQRGAEAAAAEAEATALRRRAELAERAAEQAVAASGTRLSDLEAELGKVRSDRADLESRLIQASIDLLDPFAEEDDDGLAESAGDGSAAEPVDPFADGDEGADEDEGDDGAASAPHAESVDPFAEEEAGEEAAGGAAGAPAPESVDPFADEDAVGDADEDEAAPERPSPRPPRHAGGTGPVAESSGAAFELSQSTVGGGGGGGGDDDGDDDDDDRVDGGPSWAQLSADD